jgi:hypothetical protein
MAEIKFIIALKEDDSRRPIAFVDEVIDLLPLLKRQV